MSTRYNLRKRKNTSPFEDGPKARVKRPDSRDPLQRLNQDVLNIIFEFIPSEDLIRIEGVSSAWRAAVKEWIEFIGLRSRFSPSWMPESDIRNSLTASNIPFYDHYRKRARQDFLLGTGRPTRATKLLQVHHFASQGDHVVWATRGGYDNLNLPLGDYIFWQHFPLEKGDTLSKPIKIYSHKFLEHSRVHRLSINKDGVFLMCLRVKRGLHYTPGYLNVVYSPLERRALWNQKLGETGLFTPALIGKSSIYCLKETGYRFMIAAYDFRTHEHLYTSPEHAVSGIHSEQPSDAGSQYLMHGTVRIFQTGNGKELIIAFGYAPKPPYVTTKVLIINGETGRELYSFTCPKHRQMISPPSFYLDPITDCIALVYRLYESEVFRDLQQEKPFLIIRRFLYKAGSENPVTPLTTDMALLPNNNTSSDVQQYWEFPAFEPFSLRAISVSWTGTSGLNGHVATPTDDKGLLRRAADLLRRWDSKGEFATLNQCFVVEPGSPFTLPRRPEMERYERTTASNPRYFYGRAETLGLMGNEVVTANTGTGVHAFQF